MNWIRQDKMKIERQIDQIINENVTAIASGEETLDSILARYPQLVSELRPRLEAAIWLQQVKLSVATRPGYIYDSRKYLQNKIGSMQPIRPWQRFAWRYTPQRWVFNIASSVIVLLLLALVMNSAVLTARLSIPGDPFYSTKLMLEDIQVALTFNQLDKANLHIQHSRQRALELVELVMESKYEQLPSAAARMEADVIASLHAVDDVTLKYPAEEVPLVANLRDTLSSEIFMLNVLRSTSPQAAQSGINFAIQVAQSGVLALR
jgi:hypothetical protein